MSRKILKLLILALLIQLTLMLTFPLSRTRETCLQIKQKGVHEFQYIVSGQNPTQYTCTIYSDNKVVETISDVTQYENTIDFVSENNKICFSSLDNQMKQVSFDIISINDPLKDHFSVKDQEQTHLKMFTAFQELQKVYRDQNMFIQRSVIYQNLLANREIKILFILIFKIIIAISLGGYQLMLIKDIVTTKNHRYVIPQNIQDDDSEDELQ